MEGSDAANTGTVLAAVTDLFFTVRLRAMAEDVGVDLGFTATAEEALKRVEADEPRLVVVDLETTALDPVALVRDLRKRAAPEETRIVGFLSHVHLDRKRAALDAGCDEVLSRSAFVQDLPRLLRPQEDAP